MEFLFSLMMEECANFSKISRVDFMEYISWGLKSSSKNKGLYMALTTSTNTLRDYEHVRKEKK